MPLAEGFALEAADDPPEDFVLTLEDVRKAMKRARLAVKRFAEQKVLHEADLREFEDERTAMVKRFDERTAADQREIAEASALAERYWRTRLAEMSEDDKKSIDFEWGSIRSRKQEPEFEKDEEALYAWALQAGYVRTPAPAAPKTDWARIKAEAAVIDGQLRVGPGDSDVVQGVKVVPREPTVTVEFDEQWEG